MRDDDLTTYTDDWLEEALQDDKHRQDEQDLLRLATTEWGQRFLLRLFRDCKLFGNTFTGNSHSFYFAGMRELGLKYFNELRGMQEIPDNFIGKIMRVVAEETDK